MNDPYKKSQKGEPNPHQSMQDFLNKEDERKQKEEAQKKTIAIQGLQLALENKLLLQRIYAEQLGKDVEEMQETFDEITKAAYNQARELLGLQS
ncbi:hypothetical protein D770_20475 [Flammeovirgaceae bacterium 311]|nr:hypothetical protein D770_20475 [Flammeovirgaceae bacterium 311]